MTEQVIYLVGNAFRIFIYWKLLNAVFKHSKTDQIFILIGFAAFYLINSAASIIINNFTINILTNLVPLFVLSLLYESKLLSKFFVTFAFYVVNMLADGIMYSLTVITNIKPIIITSGIATVLITFFVELIYEYICKKHISHEPDLLYLIAVFTVPLGSVIIGITTMYDYSIKTIITAIILLIFNAFIFYLYDQLQKTYELKYEKKILEQAIKSQGHELSIVNTSQDKIRYMRHDFKNHLINIESYALKKDCDNILQYIQNTFDLINVPNQLVDSGNVEIDSMLNFKLQEMIDSGVTVNYTVTIPDKVKIEGFDIIVILGNLLNNAAEALEKADEKKFMLNISFDKNILFIHMENSYNGKIAKDGEKLITTKGDPEYHGIGLKNIVNTLRKYNGDIIFSYDDSIFKTDVMICNITPITKC